jgi:hypothetical protein
MFAVAMSGRPHLPKPTPALAILPGRCTLTTLMKRLCIRRHGWR